MKIIIIGGGIVGVVTALECARLGAQVTLFESGEIGGGATNAAGGILAPLYPWQCPAPLMDLLELSRHRWQQLFSELVFDDVPRIPSRQGLLCLDQDEYADAEAWAEKYQWPYQLIKQSALQRLVPGLSADSGFLLSQVRHLEPATLMAHLRQGLRKTKVRLMQHTPVQTITVDRDNRATGIQIDGQHITGDYIVVCAGAWSTQLGIPIPVRPIRGQMIEYRYRSLNFSQAIVAAGKYFIPRSDDCLLVGSTVEDCGFNDIVTEQARESLVAFAEERLPILRTLSIRRQWAGLRPGSSRTLPLIGWHPVVENVFLNTGHFRIGIALASGSAWLTARMIYDQSVPMDVTLFSMTAD